MSLTGCVTGSATVPTSIATKQNIIDCSAWGPIATAKRVRAIRQGQRRQILQATRDDYAGLKYGARVSEQQ
jgi:hypothetical protein